MIKEAISKVIVGKDLSQDEARAVFSEIMEGACTPAQIASLITALRAKGETDAEIAGAASAMREKCVKIEVDEDVVDTCGTGGDGLHTFNISTISAFVVAGCGAKVAKHGNRSVSSKCGSADLMEGLGIRIELSKERIEECLKEAGIAFLFAPNLHPAMKYAIGPRREIGIRTVFNILGPLTNPAGARYQLLGVYDASLCVRLANVLKILGSVSAMVVHGEDGSDEVSITGRTHIAELRDGEIKEYNILPGDFGIKCAAISDIRGGYLSENVKITESILRGEESPKKDAVILNAGCALYITKKAESIKEGVDMARDAIESGSALSKLELLREISNR